MLPFRELNDEGPNVEDLRNLLDKLTPDNFESLLEQFQWNTKLEGDETHIVDLIYETAVESGWLFDELFLIKACAQICKIWSSKPSFSTALLLKCNQEIQRYAYMRNLDYSDSEKQISPLPEVEKMTFRMRAKGTFRFICELFNQAVLSEAFVTDGVMYLCMNKEESLSNLCLIATTIAHDASSGQGQAAKYCESLRTFFLSIFKKIRNQGKLLTPKIRGLIQDVTELWQTCRFLGTENSDLATEQPMFDARTKAYSNCCEVQTSAVSSHKNMWVHYCPRQKKKPPTSCPPPQKPVLLPTPVAGTADHNSRKKKNRRRKSSVTPVSTRVLLPPRLSSMRSEANSLHQDASVVEPERENLLGEEKSPQDSAPSAQPRQMLEEKSDSMTLNLNTPPDDSLWYYLDSEGVVQGPYESSVMLQCYSDGYFKDDLLVRRACNVSFLYLSDLIKLCGGIPFTAEPRLLPPVKFLHIQEDPEEVKACILSSKGPIPVKGFACLESRSSTDTCSQGTASSLEPTSEHVNCLTNNIKSLNIKEDLDEVKSNVRACILSSKRPIPVKRFMRDYESLVGSPIPYRELNYPSLEDFLQSLPSLRVYRSGADIVVEASQDNSSSHISKLIGKQKSTPKNDFVSQKKKVSSVNQRRKSSVTPVSTHVMLPPRLSSMRSEANFLHQDASGFW